MGKNIKKKKRKENKEIIEKKDIEKKGKKKESNRRKRNLQGISTQKNISMGITCKMNGGEI